MATVAVPLVWAVICFCRTINAVAVAIAAGFFAVVHSGRRCLIAAILAVAFVPIGNASSYYPANGGYWNLATWVEWADDIIDPPENWRRKGDSPFPITETAFIDGEGNVRLVRQALRYAGWGNSVLPGHDPDFVFSNPGYPVFGRIFGFEDNVVSNPLSTANLGEAVYDIEADVQISHSDSLRSQFYQPPSNVRFWQARAYPDGEMRVNFNDGDFVMRLSLDGDDADDDYGPNAVYAEKISRKVELIPFSLDDDLTLEWRGSIRTYYDTIRHLTDPFSSGSPRVVKATGIFRPWAHPTPTNELWGANGALWGPVVELQRVLSGYLDGRFYDSADYDRTSDAPVEVAGSVRATRTIYFADSGCLICASDRRETRRVLRFSGYFLGQRPSPPTPPAPTPLPPTPPPSLQFSFLPFDGMTTIDLDEYSQPITVGDNKLHQAPDGQNTNILVKSLEFAHLGIWMNSDFPDEENFQYRNLADNTVIAPTPDGLVLAHYDIKGDAVYKGVRVYPDGLIIAEFNGNRVGGKLRVNGADAIDDFGAGAKLPTISGAERSPNDGDLLEIYIGDAIDSEGFTGDADIRRASGFFADFKERGSRSVNNVANFRFHDSDDYDKATSVPREISGIFEIPDLNDEMLKGGFLGKKRQ